MNTFDVYGARFEVEGLESPVWERLLRLSGFAPGDDTSEATPQGVFHFIPRGTLYDLKERESTLAESQPFGLLVELLKARVHTLIPPLNKELLFLRGDVVCGSNEGAILLAGPSFSGKSALAQAMIALGAGAWSEYYAVVNAEGKLLPYPWPTVPQNGASLKTLGLTKASPESSGPEPLSTGQAVLELTTLLKAEPAQMPLAFPRLAALCSSSPGRLFRVHSGGAETVDNLLRGAP